MLEAPPLTGAALRGSTGFQNHRLAPGKTTEFLSQPNPYVHKRGDRDPKWPSDLWKFTQLAGIMLRNWPTIALMDQFFNLPESLYILAGQHQTTL